MSMDTGREKIKSILSCLDEEDYEQALKELENLPVSITRISLFISGVVLLLRKDWNKATKRIADLTNKIDPNASDEEYFLLCFLQSLRNIIHAKKGSQGNSLELKEERLLSTALKDINLDDVKLILRILKGISAVEETKEKELSKILELLNSPEIGLIELPIKEIISVEIFEKYYNEEQQALFLVGLLSSEIAKKLIYSLFNDAVSEIYKSITVEEQKILLERIHLLIKRIEPRLDNTEHSVPLFYKMLKRECNEWTFSWFVSQGHIEEGFVWLESTDDGKGMDFLRVIESDPNPPNKKE